MTSSIRYFYVFSISLFLAILYFSSSLPAASPGAASNILFPLPLDSYGDASMTNIREILIHRIAANPYNLIATLLFFCAIVHTFLTPKFAKIAHKWEHEHALRKEKDDLLHDKHFGAEIMHFVGEVEAVFGLWILPLILVTVFYYDWNTVVHYVSDTISYTEPMFVVVIMALASTRPIVKFSENVLKRVAQLGGNSPAAWWLTILTVTPLLGSFITEPAAMTIAALLLAKQFYELKPSKRFAYGTIGLLFVNVSVGGTLSHFAAPPVLIVAGKWNWDLAFMFTNFGWKAVIGIVISNALYFLVFRKEFAKLNRSESTDANREENESPIPLWITLSHIIFIAWTVFNSHYPVLFIGGFLFFLGFAQATAPHQSKMELKSPLLVGFFLAGLVTHGGLQGWWIAPVLGNLTEVPLMLGATFLTAFNDNAAITLLSTLVPNFSDSLKYAVVAGAVTGGGVTVIANAPNPAGQSILSKYFDGGVSALYLAMGALVPTIILGFSFMLL